MLHTLLKDMYTSIAGCLNSAGSWCANSTMSIVEYAINLEWTSLWWNVATGIYHLLLVYALHKYGLRVWFRFRNRSDVIPMWKEFARNLTTIPGQSATSVAMEEKELLEKLDLLAERGWGNAEYSQNQEPRFRQEAAAMAKKVAAAEKERSDEEEEESDTDHDKGIPVPATKSHSLPCSLILVFQCALSDRQVRKWADTMRRLFGSTRRVERFERSTIVHSSSWTHECLLHDAAALVQEASEEDQQCTLQVDSWGVFLSYTGEKVELYKLEGFRVPVIISACQVSSDDKIKIRGLHLEEAEIVAQTHEQSMRLLSKSEAYRETEELEALSVQCPPGAHLHELHVYASKTIAVDGCLISVQCDPIKVMFTTDNVSTTDSTIWILAALIITVPVAQIAWSFLYPSPGSSVAVLLGQGFGWILGWLTLQTLSARYAMKQKAPESIGKKDLSISVWRGCALFVVFILLSLLSWTHFIAFEIKLLLVGTTIGIIVSTMIVVRVKLRQTREDNIVSRRRYWMNLMSTSITYNEWSRAAGMLHPDSSLNECKYYDEEFVQGKLRELQSRRIGGSVEEILFFLRADLIRNLGNICNPQLHKHRRQIPVVIRDYVKEVRYHLQTVCEMDTEEFTLEEKLTFLTETRQRFGRTALVFSGHVALGTFHSSVFRSLVEHQLLPSVVVGANLGAIVASFATTRAPSELQHFFDDPSLPMDFYEKLSTVYVAAYRLRTQEASPYEIEKLQQSMQELLGDLTFEEAFDMSGRILGISIPACPIRNQPAQFLNYLASPHVVIWSAAAVSCMLPGGLLHRPELMIKDRYDNIVPYVPPTKMTFQKGGEPSLETEIPFQQVRELFNVNNFVVSQASPYIAPWLHYKESVQEYSPFVAKFVDMMEMEVRHRCAQLEKLGYTLRGFTSLFSKKWEGDINIVLPLTFSQAISMSRTQNDHPSPNELRKTAMAGRRCTWATLSAIQASCGIEILLDEFINELNRCERHAFSYTNRDENYHPIDDRDSPRKLSQLEVDIDWTRATMNRTQSLKGDDFYKDDAPPLEEIRGYGTPSESETEDYLLDQLCSCTRNNSQTLKCEMSHAVPDEGIQVADGCTAIADSIKTLASDDFIWSGKHDAYDIRISGLERATEDTFSGRKPPESLDQDELHYKNLHMDWDTGCEDSDRNGSPTTVLEGPTGRSRKHANSKVNDISFAGCNVQYRELASLDQIERQ